METPSVAELEQHAAILRERILQIAAEVKALLGDDLPRFVERELKRAFIGSPEFASTIDNDGLKRIKAAIQSRGEAGTKRILAALEDDALWFPESPGDDDARRSVADNKALWDVVSTISDDVNAILEEFGFPPGAEPVAYKPPSWFIGRRYLPSLSEKYWRHVRELAEARAQIGSIRTEVARSELTRRWDEI